MLKRFLLIDDDTSIFEAYKKLLQFKGREVDTASTVEMAKKLLEKHDYDIVITDLKLSGVESEEGFDIIQMAKEFHPESKIIMITAYGDHGIKERAYRMGISHYFEKPVSIHVLKDTLRRLGVGELGVDDQKKNN